MVRRKMIAVMGHILAIVEMCDDDENDHQTYDTELEEYALLTFRRSLGKPILRLKNYVEEVIPSYDDDQFKSHFRKVLYFLVYLY